MLNNRIKVLNNLLFFDKDIKDIKVELSKFNWDSPNELIVCNGDVILNVLHKYLNDEISSDDIEEWANLIESREDIGFINNKIQEIIFELANPLLFYNKSIDKNIAKLIEKTLPEPIAGNNRLCSREMKKDYQKVLDYFFDFETKKVSEKYLKKYWLDENEFNSYWLPIKNSIFRKEAFHLPDMMFNDNYGILALIGGVIFCHNDFKALQQCMRKTGDKYFVVVENSHTRLQANTTEKTLPYLRFKFPANITFKELNNGDLNFYDISFEIFMMMNKEYFVFGDSGLWGKYVANDYWDKNVDNAGTPLDIIGAQKDILDIFKKEFKVSAQDKKQMDKWLPQIYKNQQ
jgi:hypothetical protein